MEKELLRLLKQFEKHCKANKEHEQYVVDLLGMRKWLEDKLLETKPVKKEEDKDKKELNERIVHVLKKFNQVNPSVGYGNRGHRKAIQDMLSVMSFEEACDMVDYALRIQGKPYAPIITTPMELKYKQDKLTRYSEFNT